MEPGDHSPDAAATAAAAVTKHVALRPHSRAARRYDDGMHRKVLLLKSDLTAAVHTYTTRWREVGIDWLIDGVLVHQVRGTAGIDIPWEAMSVRVIVRPKNVPSIYVGASVVDLSHVSFEPAYNTGSDSASLGDVHTAWSAPPSPTTTRIVPPPPTLLATLLLPPPPPPCPPLYLVGKIGGLQEALAAAPPALSPSPPHASAASSPPCTVATPSPPPPLLSPMSTESPAAPTPKQLGALSHAGSDGGGSTASATSNLAAQAAPPLGFEAPPFLAAALEDDAAYLAAVGGAAVLVACVALGVVSALCCCCRRQSAVKPRRGRSRACTSRGVRYPQAGEERRQLGVGARALQLARTAVEHAHIGRSARLGPTSRVWTTKANGTGGRSGGRGSRSSAKFARLSTRDEDDH